MEGYFEPVLLDRVARGLETSGRARSESVVLSEGPAKRAFPAFAGYHSQSGSGPFLGRAGVQRKEWESAILFHGLVHAAQLRLLGVAEFYRVVRARIFGGARSYFLAPMKSACILLWMPRFACESRCALFAWKTKFATGGEPEDTVSASFSIHRRNPNDPKPSQVRGAPCLRPWPEKSCGRKRRAGDPTSFVTRNCF